MIYAFDIDGTICTDTKGDYPKCKPYEDVIKKINELYHQHTIILFTARGTTSGRDLYDFTKEQLNDIKSEELDRIFVKGKKELVTIYKPEANLMEGYDFTSKKKVTTNSKKDNKK